MLTCVFDFAAMLLGFAHSFPDWSVGKVRDYNRAAPGVNPAPMLDTVCADKLASIPSRPVGRLGLKWPGSYDTTR